LVIGKEVLGEVYVSRNNMSTTTQQNRTRWVRSSLFLHFTRRKLAVFKDVSEQSVDHILNGQAVQEECRDQPSQAKVLTGGGDLRFAQVDVPLSVSHSCVCSQSWAQWQTP